MAKVIARVNPETKELEDVESLLRRFKKKVLNDGIAQELKKREYYRAPSLKRKEKSKEAQKRLRTKAKK